MSEASPSPEVTEQWSLVASHASAAWRETAERLAAGNDSPGVLKGIQAAADGGMPEVLKLLSSGSTLPNTLLDPRILNRDEAAEALRAAEKVETSLDVKILQAVMDPRRGWPDRVPEERMGRALDLLELMDDIHTGTQVMLRQFLRLPLERIRSRAVKLMVRVMPSMDWVDGALSDPDPRVRSNLLETLMRYAPVYTGSLRMLLKRASMDPHHRVKVTALYLMASRNDRQSRAVLDSLLDSGDEMTSSAARWAIGKLEAAKSANEPVSE